MERKSVSGLPSEKGVRWRSSYHCTVSYCSSLHQNCPEHSMFFDSASVPLVVYSLLQLCVFQTVGDSIQGHSAGCPTVWKSLTIYHSCFVYNQQHILQLIKMVAKHMEEN